MSLVNLPSVPTTRVHGGACSLWPSPGKHSRARSRPHVWLRSNAVCAQQPQDAPAAERFDVSSNCIQPVFRSIPNKSQRSHGDEKVRVLFLSESNTCRSVYAEAMFNNILRQNQLENILECASKGTREYNVGEKPDDNVLEVAEDLGLDIKDHEATVFNCAKDVIAYDLLIVMDKFTASDVLKDVTLFETIDTSTDYCWKVRRLGEFCLGRKIEDIDDPLYGNIGGEEEVEELHRAALDIHDSCNGLINFLSEILSSIQENETLKTALARAMNDLAPTDWIKPPLLQSA